MPFSVFTTTTNSRTGRTYSTAKLAQQEADVRNAKAESLSITSRYEVQPHTPTDPNDRVRDSFKPLPA
jgi:hypothetical protein